MLVVALLSLAACGGGDRAAYEASETATPAPQTTSSTSTPETATPTPAATRPAPCTAPPATAAAPDWPHPNYDATGSRATFTSTITSENVGKLKEAWRYELPSGGAFGIVATTPIVVGTTVYLGDLQTNVHAIDLESGNRRWVVDNEQWVYGPSGVAVSGGCVFSNLGGHSVAAYRTLDGERLWDTKILEHGGAVNFQPLVVGGIVFAATSSLSQPGARGALYALDPSTGDIRWSFNTIVSEDVLGEPEDQQRGRRLVPARPRPRGGRLLLGHLQPLPLPRRPRLPPRREPPRRQPLDRLHPRRRHRQRRAALGRSAHPPRHLRP